MATKKKTTSKKIATKKAEPVKATKAKEPKTKKASGKMSALDAAAKVLADAGKPMSTGEMIEAMGAKGLWKSPGGKTPDRTLYSAILREINTKAKDARFKKTDRGHFTANG
jgi:hypothetical protein